jgi:hypothetical protein
MKSGYWDRSSHSWVIDIQYLLSSLNVFRNDFFFVD